MIALQTARFSAHRGGRLPHLVPAYGIPAVNTLSRHSTRVQYGPHVDHVEFDHCRTRVPSRHHHDDVRRKAQTATNTARDDSRCPRHQGPAESIRYAEELDEAISRQLATDPGQSQLHERIWWISLGSPRTCGAKAEESPNRLSDMQRTTPQMRRRFAKLSEL